MASKATFITEDILTHLHGILSKTVSASGLKSSFQEIAEGKNFTKQQLGLLLRHASVTAFGDIDHRCVSLWTVFKDGLVKRVSFSQHENDLKETAMDIIIFSKWANENYPMIMGFQKSENAPNIFSRAADVSNFKTFLSYLEKEIVPALKKSLCHENGLSGKDLECALSAREKAMLESTMEGVEILKPIPFKKWEKASSGPL